MLALLLEVKTPRKDDGDFQRAGGLERMHSAVDPQSQGQTLWPIATCHQLRAQPGDPLAVLGQEHGVGKADVAKSRAKSKEGSVRLVTVGSD